MSKIAYPNTTSAAPTHHPLMVYRSQIRLLNTAIILVFIRLSITIGLWFGAIDTDTALDILALPHGISNGTRSSVIAVIHRVLQRHNLSPFVRANVCRALQNYTTTDISSDQKPTKCVVCLDDDSAVIGNRRCGHFCICQSCSNIQTLTKYPLCRMEWPSLERLVPQVEDEEKRSDEFVEIV